MRTPNRVRLSHGLWFFLLSPGSQASSLEEVRKVKDAEIEKYKKYLNKAKKIIEGFGEGKSRAAEDSLEVTTELDRCGGRCVIL